MQSASAEAEVLDPRLSSGQRDQWEDGDLGSLAPIVAHKR